MSEKVLMMNLMEGMDNQLNRITWLIWYLCKQRDVLKRAGNRWHLFDNVQKHTHLLVSIVEKGYVSKKGIPSEKSQQRGIKFLKICYTRVLSRSASFIYSGQGAFYQFKMITKRSFFYWHITIIVSLVRSSGRIQTGFSVSHDVVRVNGHKLKHRKFNLNIMKKTYLL